MPWDSSWAVIVRKLVEYVILVTVVVLLLLVVVIVVIALIGIVVVEHFAGSVGIVVNVVNVVIDYPCLHSFDFAAVVISIVVVVVLRYFLGY